MNNTANINANKQSGHDHTPEDPVKAAQNIIVPVDPEKFDDILWNRKVAASFEEERRFA